MTPKVSVIIPVYNVEDFLGECLDTLLTQTLEDIEIICVDDESKDDSLSTLQGYSFLDSRLKLISIPHAGSAAARNRALSEVSGEFVYFANAYDFFDEKMLETMVKKAEEDGSDVVISSYHFLNQPIKEITAVKLDEELLKLSPCRPQEMADELFAPFQLVGWNKLVRADLIRKLELQFDENVKYGNDLVFNAMFLAGATKISLIKDCLVCHRINLNPLKKEDEFQHFIDNTKNFAHLFHAMEKKSLFSEFDLPYYFGLQNVIWSGLPVNKRGEALMAILKNLPDQVINYIVAPSEYEPEISIIVPVYNASSFLRECLDSLIHQTIKEIEIICVDDGSDDDSLNILNEYAQKDARIKVLTQEKQGLSAACDKGMEAATGTYLQFVSPNDYLAPNACKLLYVYSRIFSLDMLSFAAVEFDSKTKEEFEDPRHTLDWMPKNFPLVVTSSRSMKNMLRLSMRAGLTFYRRMFLLRNEIHWGCKNTTFEDAPFFIEAAFHPARMGTLNLPLYFNRIHSEVSNQNAVVQFHDLISIYKYTLKTLQHMDVPKEIVGAYAEAFLDKIYQNYLQFEQKDKEEEKTTLYNLCLNMLKKYHVSFSKALLNWIELYLKSKKTKKKIKFKFYLLCSKLIKDNYVIPFFEFHRLPDFKIKIFSIPLLEIKIEKQDLYSFTSKILGIPFISVKGVRKYGDGGCF